MGFDIVMWSAKKDIILDKGYTCVCLFFFFSFFCNSENKKKASVRLKCNGVQFKCNTVNSKKKVKTAKQLILDDKETQWFFFCCFLSCTVGSVEISLPKHDSFFLQQCIFSWVSLPGAISHVKNLLWCIQVFFLLFFLFFFVVYIRFDLLRGKHEHIFLDAAEITVGFWKTIQNRLNNGEIRFSFFFFWILDKRKKKFLNHKSAM